MLFVIIVFDPLFEAFVMVDVFRRARLIDNYTLVFDKIVYANWAFILDLRLTIPFLILLSSFFHLSKDCDHSELFLTELITSS